MSFKPVENPVSTFKLEEPIQAFGTQITEISIRAPTAADLFQAGNPVIDFDYETGAYRFDERKAMLMLSRLSGIPLEGSLEKLTAEDAVYCWEGLGPFFVKGLRKLIAAHKEFRALAAAEASSKKPGEPLESSPDTTAAPLSNS